MISQASAIKRNTFFVVNKKFPNSITAIFLLMQFMYGFNFGFIGVRNKKIRNYCKVIYILICLYTSVLLLLRTPIFATEWDIREFWGSLFFVQYCGHVVVLNFSKYKVQNFISDIRSISYAIIHSKEHKIGLWACVLFVLYFTLTLMLTAVACIAVNSGCMLDNNLLNTIYMFSVIGLDAIVGVQLVVNSYTYYAVIYLVGLVEKEKISVIRKQFLRISECCDKFGGYYGYLAIMELSIHLPKYLTLICDFIYKIHTKTLEKNSLVRLPYSIYVIFELCAPAVSVELVNKQMENVRFKLYTRLMKEKDIEKHLELSSLLRYMEQKPLYSNSWRVIPSDIKLVVALFSFVTTQVIVVMQFMHIY